VCVEILGGPRWQFAGASQIAQVFHVPENVTYAPLTFWYKMETDDFDVAHDYFRAEYAVLEPGGDHGTLLGPICADTGWTLAGPFDMTPYKGKDVGICFIVRQDGNFGCTFAYVDDVELCADIDGPPDEGPPPEGSCWKQRELVDYAPNGVPDFDMRQDQWRNPQEQWIYDGPAALANSLWWMDSKFEQELAPSVVAPPEISDHYPLVEAYGEWDDHAEENVQPFIQDLADYLDTNNKGTTPEEMYEGILDYLEAKGLDDEYTVTMKPLPSVDWIRSEVLRCEDVMVLLGFWERQGEELKRLGGHWVTVPGVDCEHEPKIGLSDPWFDRAEYGWPGEWYPNIRAHPHPPEPPDTVHNDAKYLSHDLYDVFRAGEGYAVAGYAPEYEDIENFFGLNTPPGYEGDQAEEYEGGDIATDIEVAIAVSPYTDTVIIRIDPLLNHVIENGFVAVDVMVDSGEQPVNAVELHLNFNRAKLRIVDEDGNPADQVIPGEDFSAVYTNVADNANGKIDFEAATAGGVELTGSFRVATLRFWAADKAPLGATVDVVAAGDRQSRLLYGGTDIPYERNNGIVVISEGATILGDASMEGRPQGPRWAVPLHVTLHQPGEDTEVAGYFVDANNAGDFQVGGLELGTYDVKVKGNHTLRSVVRNVTLNAGNNAVNFGTLVEGDANNDNIVDLLDAVAVQAAYGKSEGESGFDPNCDFDENGVVNIGDVSILNVNFGRMGDVVVGGGSQAATDSPSTLSAVARREVNSAADTVTVSLDPMLVDAGPGDVFELTLGVDAGTQAVDGVQIYLDFDPEILQVVDAQGNPVTSINDAGVFDNVIENSVDNSAGEVDYAATVLEGSKPSGAFVVGTLRFQVLQSTTMTRIRFSTVEPRYTQVVVGGEYAPLRLVAAQVNVNMLSLDLPLVLKG